jgi:hypothetical protein
MMSSIKKQLFVLVTIFSFYPLLAQNTHILGVFPTIDHSGSLTEKWEYSLYYFGAFNLLDLNSSKKSNDPHLGAFYAENALSYHLNKNFSVTGSYVYERQNVFQTSFRNENRFYVQATHKLPLKNSVLKNRIRYDGRFIENRNDQTWPYTSRLRYLIGIKTPLKKEAGKTYFAAYNELFFNTIKKTPFIYAENWAFAGFGYKLDRTNTIEAGPLYIFWVNNAKYQLTNFYYLQISWISHINY